MEAVDEAAESSTQARTHPGGRTQQDLLLSMMEEKLRNQGLQSATLKKEMTFFSDTMAKNFTNLMV